MGNNPRKLYSMTLISEGFESFTDINSVGVCRHSADLLDTKDFGCNRFLQTFLGVFTLTGEMFTGREENLTGRPACWEGTSELLAVRMIRVCSSGETSSDKQSSTQRSAMRRPWNSSTSAMNWCFLIALLGFKCFEPGQRRACPFHPKKLDGYAPGGPDAQDKNAKTAKPLAKVANCRGRGFPCLTCH